MTRSKQQHIARTYKPSADAMAREYRPTYPSGYVPRETPIIPVLDRMAKRAPVEAKPEVRVIRKTPPVAIQPRVIDRHAKVTALIKRNHEGYGKFDPGSVTGRVLVAMQSDRRWWGSEELQRLVPGYSESVGGLLSNYRRDGRIVAEWDPEHPRSKRYRWVGTGAGHDRA